MKLWLEGNQEMEDNKKFFEFLLRKDFDFPSIEQDLSDRWREDEFNCEYAEAALDIAFDLYPDGSEDNDSLMDKRHEFVSEFLEHMRCEVVKKWAGNLGMVTIAKAQENANAQAEEVSKMWKRRIDLQADNFRKMSCYEFSQWKMDAIDKEQKANAERITQDHFDPCELDIHYDNSSDRIPQDSEDEAWEQMKAFQRDNFKDIPDSFLKDN